jgi:hypothetical protein
VRADTAAVEEFLNLFGEITEEGGYLLEQAFNVRSRKFILEKNA